MQLQMRAVFLSRNGQLDAAIPLCEQAVKTAPFSAVAHYNMACLLAKKGQVDDALKSLRQAIELGFHNVAQISKDSDLKPLRSRPEFDDLLKEAGQPFTPAAPKPNPMEDGVAWVGPENTVWDESTNLLRTSFDWVKPEKTPPIVLEHDRVGIALRQWFGKGTAAGHFGDLYDNCDRDHSNLNYKQFPQLNRIEYRKEIAADTANGLQTRILHGGVVLGNASTAMVGEPFWRSNARMAHVHPASMVALTMQYFQNHLYLYPEHRDHDAGHNGKPIDGAKEGGYGDVLLANTPYVLISQGSSFTDQPFMDAMACTMAAFHPDVKRLLVERGLMAPTLQQIFRRSNKQVRKPEDYLTGLAHPSVFEGTQIDTLKMIIAAHSLTPESIPPIARLKVEKQDRGIVGRDYFEIADREVLFDTPCAIARIGRSVQFRRKMTISARDSFDVNKKPLTYRWVVLRGDESRIEIKPLDETGERAEVTVAWHPRRKIQPGSNMESNRVDIGVFAHNGEHWSPPAFITWMFLDNEEREYDDQGRILSVDYHGGTDEGNYTDPYIDTPKTWKDTYQYAADGRLIGWTRVRGTGLEQKSEHFTAEGSLVLEQDDSGRALKAQSVRYVAMRPEGKTKQILVQQPAEDIWHYVYAGPEDKIGRIRSHEKVVP